MFLTIYQFIELVFNYFGKTRNLSKVKVAPVVYFNTQLKIWIFSIGNSEKKFNIICFLNLA